MQNENVEILARMRGLAAQAGTAETDADPANPNVVPPTTQAREPEPRKWTIHRNRRGWIAWYQRWFEAWWIVTGQWSLHRAWQDGVWHGTDMEYRRTVINGGR